jgi:hypothetical protein
MTNPAPISEALRDALAKVPDEWTPWYRVPITDQVGADLHAKRLISSRTDRLHGARVERVRRTAAGRSLMEQKG